MTYRGVLLLAWSRLGACAKSATGHIQAGAGGHFLNRFQVQKSNLNLAERDAGTLAWVMRPDLGAALDAATGAAPPGPAAIQLVAPGRLGWQWRGMEAAGATPRRGRKAQDEETAAGRLQGNMATVAASRVKSSRYFLPVIDDLAPVEPLGTSSAFLKSLAESFCCSELKLYPAIHPP